MANNGNAWWSFSTQEYPSSETWAHLYLQWELVRQSNETRTSTIRWWLEVAADGGQIACDTECPWKVTIDGKEWSGTSSPNISEMDGTVAITPTYTADISHDILGNATPGVKIELDWGSVEYIHPAFSEYFVELV